jgi:hypothetical protein
MNKYSYVGKFSGSGSKNTFYKVKGKKYGFKGFPNKSLATFAHAVQSELAPYLAPEVYSPVCKIRVPNYFATSDGRGGIKAVTHMVLSDWGYLTEIASTYFCDSEDCDGDCAHCDLCENYSSIQDMLGDISDNYGLSYNDAHPNNLGYVKRGDKRIIVPIDFGAESVSDDGDNFPEVCWDGDEDSDCYCEQCRARYNNV